MSYSVHGFIGRLTKDPEFREVPSNGEQLAVVNFTVAVDKDRGEGADFYNVVAWRGLAQNVHKFLTKGRLVFVSGRPSSRTYSVTKEGVEFDNRVSEVTADVVQFLDRAPQNGSEGHGGNQSYTPPTQAQQQQAYTGPAPF